MKHGIILAAGEARRLPNKALLPMRDGAPVMTSGLRLLQDSECERICVVVGPSSPIPAVLRAKWPGLNYVVQEEPTGVVAAAACAGFSPSDIVAVTFCDNIFTPTERITWEAPVVAVRYLSGAAHLDKWDARVGRWADRSVDSPWCIAGWFVVRGSDLLVDRPDRGPLPAGSVEYYNSVHAVPHVVDLPWWDIGTLEEYARYWG